MKLQKVKDLTGLDPLDLGVISFLSVTSAIMKANNIKIGIKELVQTLAIIGVMKQYNLTQDEGRSLFYSNFYEDAIFIGGNLY